MLNGQTKMVANELTHQNATNGVAKSATPNQASLASEQSSPGQNNANRTQDDAMVGYVFQRQNDAEFQPYGKSSRWFGAEDSDLIDVCYLVFFSFIMHHLMDYF